MLQDNISYIVWPLFGGLVLLTALLTGDATLPPVALSRPDAVTEVRGSTFPKTIIDPYNRKFVLTEPPRKVVSAMLATDEIVVDLLEHQRQRIGAVTSLAGIADISNCARQVEEQDLPKIPGLKVEPVVKMQPDLVIVSRLSDPQTILQLRQCHIRVFSVGRFDSLAEIRKNVITLGQVLGVEDRAEQIANRMDKTLATVRAQTKELKDLPRVLYYDNGYTAGKNTVFDELVRIAGGRNAATEAGVTGYDMLPTEMVIAINPDVVVIPQPLTTDIQKQIGRQKSFLENPLFGSLHAVQNKRVYVLPSQHLNSVSHHVAKAAVDLVQVLHPSVSR